MGEFAKRSVPVSAWRLLAGCLVGLVGMLGMVGAAEKPNVLFIPVDDLNDWIGCLGGHPQTKTPNLDKLAAKGVLFTDAHCAAPACNPSRAALLTGRRPFDSGVYLNPQPWRAVNEKTVTLPQHFMANGYHVLGGGKVFHGAYEDRGSWHEWFEEGPWPRLPEAEKKNLHSKAGGVIWGNLGDLPDSELGDYRTASWAIDYLKREHEKPFFLACGFKKPHMPWQVPSKYYDLFPVDGIILPEVIGNDLDDIPPAGLKMARPEGDHATMTKTENWKYAVQGYLATIAFLDGQVGRVIEALESGPNAADTIVMLWGDHGWHLGEKEHWRKFALWDRATHAPLMVVAPGVTKAGGRCGVPVDFMGIYPTLCDLCGIGVPEQVEATSFRVLLEDPGAAWESGPAICTHGRGNHAVISKEWRYIRYANGDEELYDREKDPREWRNLASNPEFLSVKRGLGAFLPKEEAPDAPFDKGKAPGRKKKSAGGAASR